MPETHKVHGNSIKAHVTKRSRGQAYETQI